MNKRLCRSEMLLGDDAIAKLAAAHVAVFGLGGVGSYCAEALARGGVGHLTIVDDDVIAESNINRQLYALTSTVGQAKTDVAAARIADINPDCIVTKKRIRYEKSTTNEFDFAGVHGSRRVRHKGVSACQGNAQRVEKTWRYAP